MEENLESKRQVLDLEFLGNLLDEAGQKNQLMNLKEQPDVNFLLTPISETCVLQLMYIPVGNLINETNLLQFFGTFTPELPKEQADIRRFLEFINTRTPLGYFSISDDQRIFYRFVYAMPRFSVPKKETFLEVFDLYAKNMEAMTSILGEMIEGKFNFEQALEKLNG